MIAGTLHTKIAIVCPITGVSVGNTDDKATWTVHYDNADDKQKAAAQAVIDGFDVAAEQAKIDSVIEYKRKALLNAAKELAIADEKLDVATEIQKEITSIGVSK